MGAALGGAEGVDGRGGEARESEGREKLHVCVLVGRKGRA